MVTRTISQHKPPVCDEEAEGYRLAEKRLDVLTGKEDQRGALYNRVYSINAGFSCSSSAYPLVKRAFASPYVLGFIRGGMQKNNKLIVMSELGVAVGFQRNIPFDNGVYSSSYFHRVTSKDGGYAIESIPQGMLDFLNQGVMLIRNGLGINEIGAEYQGFNFFMNPIYSGFKWGTDASTLTAYPMEEWGSETIPANERRWFLCSTFNPPVKVTVTFTDGTKTTASSIGGAQQLTDFYPNTTDYFFVGWGRRYATVAEATGGSFQEMLGTNPRGYGYGIIRATFRNIDMQTGLVAGVSYCSGPYSYDTAITDSGGAILHDPGSDTVYETSWVRAPRNVFTSIPKPFATTMRKRTWFRTRGYGVTDVVTDWFYPDPIGSPSTKLQNIIETTVRYRVVFEMDIDGIPMIQSDTESTLKYEVNNHWTAGGSGPQTTRLLELSGSQLDLRAHYILGINDTYAVTYLEFAELSALDTTAPWGTCIRNITSVVTLVRLGVGKVAEWKKTASQLTNGSPDLVSGYVFATAPTDYPPSVVMQTITNGMCAMVRKVVFRGDKVYVVAPTAGSNTQAYVVLLVFSISQGSVTEVDLTPTVQGVSAYPPGHIYSMTDVLFAEVFAF